MTYLDPPQCYECGEYGCGDWQEGCYSASDRRRRERVSEASDAYDRAVVNPMTGLLSKLFPWARRWLDVG